jgi:hypothetical protein
MTRYIDKTHRIKKIDGWWVPQWKRGFLRWGRYTLMVADTAMGSIELYSESWRDVMFHTELQATRFMEKAMAQGCKGKFYVGFDDCLPFGIKEW